MFRRGPETASSGFTLIEVMISLAIAGLVLGLYLSNIRGGLRVLGVSEHRAQAISLARSYLDATGVVTPLTPGTREGQATPEFSWQQGIVLRDRTQAGLSLYEVRVVFTWAEGPDQQTVGLTTLMLAGPGGVVQ